MYKDNFYTILHIILTFLAIFVGVTVTNTIHTLGMEEKRHNIEMCVADGYKKTFCILEEI